MFHDVFDKGIVDFIVPRDWLLRNYLKTRLHRHPGERRGPVCGAYAHHG